MPSQHSDFAMFGRFLARAAAKSALVLAIPAIVTAVYVAKLHDVGELLAPGTIASLGLSPERIVWLTGYYDTGFLHKLDVATSVAPKVAVIGTSRVMAVRAEFFRKLPASAFYNLGVARPSTLT